MRKKTEERIKKRKMAYVYLMYRMFGGVPDKMLEVMKPKDVLMKDLVDWDVEFKEQVMDIIRQESPNSDEFDTSAVPTIKSIKEKVLKRTSALIATTDDPARLAQVYKTLSEFESTDERKEKSVIDAVNENVKPLAKKDEEKPVTMLDVLRADGKAPIVPAPKKRGRPKKVDSQNVNENSEE